MGTLDYPQEFTLGSPNIISMNVWGPFQKSLPCPCSAASKIGGVDDTPLYTMVYYELAYHNFINTYSLSSSCFMCC